MKYRTRKAALDALGSGVYESLNGPLAMTLGRDLLEQQVDTIVALQTRKMRFMPIVSFLGAGAPTMVYACLLRWLDTTGLGWRPSHTAAVTLCVSGIMKIIGQGPRPYWLSDKVAALDPTLETSYGFPSGHVTSAVSIFGIIAWHYQRLWLWAAVIMFVGLIAYSRVYTGAHFFHDVIGGVLCGSLILLMDIFMEVVIGHIPGTRGSLAEAASLAAIGLLAFGTVLHSAGASGRVKLMVVYEAVSGAGFALGVVAGHLCEVMFPPPCQECIHLTPLQIVWCFAVIVAVQKIVKRLPDYPDGTRDFWSLACTTLGFGAIQFWAMWLVPRLYSQCDGS